MSIGRVNHFLGPRGWAEVVDFPPCLSQKSRLVASATKPGTSAFVLVLCRFFTAKFGILTVAATDRPAFAVLELHEANDGEAPTQPQRIYRAGRGLEIVRTVVGGSTVYSSA